MSINVPPVAGSPDFQPSQISNQVLLASVTNGSGAVTVTPPLGTRALLLFGVTAFGLNTPNIYVEGLQTGDTYVGANVVGSNVMGGQAFPFVDISTAVDTQYKVSITPAPVGYWYVVADLTPRAVVDVGALADSNGVRFCALSPSGPGIDDNPPHDLSFAGGVFSASGNVATPSGATTRLRLFTLTAQGTSNALTGYLYDTVTGKPLLGVANSSYSSVTFFPSGLPISQNSPLAWSLTSGAGSVIVSATYTIEAA